MNLRQTLRACGVLSLVALLAPVAWGQFPFCTPGNFTSLGNFTAAGSVVFDTDALTYGGAPGGVVSGDFAVFTFDSITVPLGSSIVGVGSRPLALLSNSTVVIDGVVDLDGASSINFNNGPFGGGAGGDAGGAGPGSNPGGGVGGGGPGVAGAGSGGGGHGGAGGNGGVPGFGGTAGIGGPSHGDLSVGFTAGAGGGASGTGGAEAGGGGGGGGLLVNAVAGITVSPTGVVSASGGGGAVSGQGGSGGGAGGGILLSSLTVTNDGIIRANGGVGGEGGCCGAGGGGGGGRILVDGVSGGVGAYSVAGGATGLGGGGFGVGAAGTNGATGSLIFSGSICQGGCCTNGPGTESECIVTSQADCETNESLFLGRGTGCPGALDCVALLVTMESISAEATAEGVLLTWTTITETDTIGFRVLRESPGATEKALDVIAPMITAAGNGLTGATYQFLDNSKQAANAVHYFVEDVDVYGRATRHGPITVQRGSRERDPGNPRIRAGKNP